MSIKVRTSPYERAINALDSIPRKRNCIEYDLARVEVLKALVREERGERVGTPDAQRADCAVHGRGVECICLGARHWMEETLRARKALGDVRDVLFAKVGIPGMHDSSWERECWRIIDRVLLAAGQRDGGAP